MLHSHLDWQNLLISVPLTSLIYLKFNERLITLMSHIVWIYSLGVCHCSFALILEGLPHYDAIKMKHVVQQKHDAFWALRRKFISVT